MLPVLDAWWRAAAYCLHPRTIVWSLAPLLVAGGLAGVLGWFLWEEAVAGMRHWLDHWGLSAVLLRWLDAVGAPQFRSLIAPLMVIVLAVPALVLTTLLLVTWLMAPALARMVVERRFAGLVAHRETTLAQGLAWSLGHAAIAVIALAASVPLWFIPPLALVVPALVWGWLSARVLAFDVLADHASRDERRTLLKRERWPLLAMGLTSGAAGALPSVIWVASAATLIFAPVLVLVSVWLYTLVFAFAALWFAHYLLAALHRSRVDAFRIETA
jgi:hypothetical protein